MSTSPNPFEVYHAAWLKASKMFYFKDRMHDWSDWEHKFDSEITDVESAVRCANKMLDTLLDPYTFVKSPQRVCDDKHEREIAPPIASSLMLPGSIGYLRVDSLDADDATAQVQKELQKLALARGFILDLRNNGGGLVGPTLNIMSLFMGAGPVVTFRRFTSEGEALKIETVLTKSRFEERTFDSSGRQIEYTTWGRRDNVTGNKPLIVLVGRHTASCAELMAGTLRDNRRALVIGDETYGKGISQMTFDLPEGCALKITNAIFLPPSQEFFGDCGVSSCAGVKPDVYVEQPVEPYADLQLEAAVDKVFHMLNAPRRRRRAA